MLITIKLVIFVLVSIGIVRISHPSLKSIHMHGFYRFFAWEAVLMLILVNMEHVVHGPISLREIAAYACLVISASLAIHGFLLLHFVGKPNGLRTDPALFWIEKTTVLVTVGAYRYVRHPLYCSFLFLTWSVFLIHVSIAGWILALIATFSLIAAAIVEERENVHFFGQTYSDYIRRTKMFLPFLI